MGGTNKSRARLADAAAIDAVPLHQAAEGAAILAGAARGLRDVAVVTLEHLAHVLALEFLDGAGARDAEAVLVSGHPGAAVVGRTTVVGLCRREEVRRQRMRALGADKRALHDVIELAYIARPVLAAQLHQREQPDALAAHAVLVADGVEEVAREQRNVVAAIAKREHVQAQHAETE